MGAETIIQKINEKAAGEAVEIRRAGEERARELERKTLDSADAKASRVLENARREADSIRHRERLNASLEARKNTLAQKRILVDEVFRLALDRLCSLEEKEWEEHMTRLVLEECLPGKVVVHASARDIERLHGPLLIKWSAELTAKYGVPCILTLCREPAKFKGGLLFEGEDCDLDASFESILRDVREQHEREIAAMLFGEEEDHA